MQGEEVVVPSGSMLIFLKDVVTSTAMEGQVLAMVVGVLVDGSTSSTGPGTSSLAI